MFASCTVSTVYRFTRQWLLRRYSNFDLSFSALLSENADELELVRTDYEIIHLNFLGNLIHYE
jgi:hypothetical protein